MIYITAFVFSILGGIIGIMIFNKLFPAIVIQLMKNKISRIAERDR